MKEVKDTYHTHLHSIDRKYFKAAKKLLQEIHKRMFTVYLQPKINLSDEKLNGAEALVRKLNGKGNLVPPIDFIPELEQNGLICFVDFSFWKLFANIYITGRNMAKNLSRYLLICRVRLYEKRMSCRRRWLFAASIRSSRR